MKLVSARIRNFRCLQDVTIRFQPDITLLIGENDAGKSSVLDILEMVLNTPYCTSSKIPQPQEADFLQDTKGNVKPEIIVELVFEVSKEYQQQDFVEHGKMFLRFTYRLDNENSLKFEIKKKKYEIEELNENIEKMKASEQKALLRKLGKDPSEYKNANQRIEAIVKIREEQPTTFEWSEINFSDLKNLGLPRWDRYRALDYQQPENLVQKTLRGVFVNILRDEELQQHIDVVQERAKQAIQEKIKDLESYVERFLNNSKGIDYEPHIDFSAAFKGGEFRINKGQGLHHLSRVGDGTKRRMLMALMEWDREVQNNIASDEPMIRGYDEPDTNLHPNAQRQFIQTVKKLAKDLPNMQIILCTHSVFMLNAVPISNIVHLKMNQDGFTDVEIFEESEKSKDDEIRHFMENIAFQLGLTNATLFFDRCYLLVEGETEYVALPILYRALYGHSMAEDGITIINLGGAKSAAALFRLLAKRASLVLFLLDTDVSKDMEDDLKNHGWPDDKIRSVIFQIGDKEFEDAFSDQLWAEVAQKNWQRLDGKAWTAKMIRKVRDGKDSINSGKFSQNLCNVIQRDASIKGGLGKPEMGQKLAEYLSQNPDDIPESIKDVFERAREIAGV